LLPCSLLLLVQLSLYTLLPADWWLQASVALQQLVPQELLWLSLPCLQRQTMLPLLPAVLPQASHHPCHQPPMQPTAWPYLPPQLLKLSSLPAMR
jgi:hypothetical protein